MHFFKIITWCIVALGCTGTAVARPENITPGELALTPEFCQDVQTMNGWEKHRQAPRTPQWLGMMGDDFWHMHHYCWGLIHIHRSRAAGLSPQTRSFYRREAISDYDYVIKNSRPSFVLLPEMYYRIGEAHALLEEPVLSIAAFAKARSIKPDYWPAYIGGAQVLESIGKKADARRLIEEGLQRLPEDPQLQSYLLRLGGKATNASSEPLSPPQRTSVTR